MKMDKDTLMKHRFWVVLAIAAPLALGAIFFLLVIVGGSIAATRKDLDKKIGSIPKVNDPKNDKCVEVKKGDAEKVISQKDVAWKEAWDKQAHYFTWPRKFVDTDDIDFQDGTFITEVKVLKEMPAKVEEKDRLAAVVKSPDLIGNFLTVKASESDYARVGLGKRANKEGELKLPRSGVLNTVTDERGDEKDKRRYLLDLKPGDKVLLTLQKSRYFDEPLTERERELYPKREYYYSQIDSILSQVSPVDDKGNGICWLGTWRYKKGQRPNTADKFFRYVPFPWNNESNISSQAWIAQEDLWIQREMYYRIKLANDYLSKMQGEGVKEFNKPATFKNPYWELILTLKGDEETSKLEVTITNLLPRRQKLEGLKFKVKLNSKAPAQEIVMQGLALDAKDETVSDDGAAEEAADEAAKAKPGKGKNVKGTKNAKGEKKHTTTLTFPLADGIPRDGVHEVHQVLTVNTAAVKRIEQISIGSMASGDISFAHRTIVEGLKPLKAEEKKEEVAKEVKGDGDIAAKIGRGGNLFPGGELLGAGQAKDNGINKVRYMEVTEQFRRLPVALVLVVDQDHIERVLTAFRNSPMRFKITQITMNRYAHSLEVTEGTEQQRPGMEGQMQMPMNPFMPRGGGGRPLPGAGPVAMPGGFPAPIGPAGQPGAIGAGPIESSGPVADEQDVAIELVLYGEVTLYNRYPPKAPSPEQKN
jgi:hypothetical protein